MFNLDLGLFNLREFPLVTEVFSSKRLFEGMASNPLSILNVSIRSPRCLLSSRVVIFKYLMIWQVRYFRNQLGCSVLNLLK